MTEQQSDTVTEVIDGREGVYGDPVEGMRRTAQIWSGILGTEVTPAQVPLMLMGYKLMRASVCPEYSDNTDDLEGYLDITRKVVGVDMIHARTVSEFIEQRERRDRARAASEFRESRPKHEPETRGPEVKGGVVYGPSDLYEAEVHSEECQSDHVLHQLNEPDASFTCRCTRLAVNGWIAVPERKAPIYHLGSNYRKELHTKQCRRAHESWKRDERDLRSFTCLCPAEHRIEALANA